jgi:PAS domain S-box-containing protein
MKIDSTYAVETNTKTRNLGLVTSLLLVPLLFGFMYIDKVTPSLQGILGWRIGTLIPAVFFLAYAIFFFPKHPGLAVPLHTVQLFGLITTMCGITAELVTRPEFPPFGRTALISSLLLCIFADFVFAAGARKYLFAILVPPLAVMAVYITVAGKAMTQTERLWLISNPAAMAVVLSVLGLYQERSSVKEHRARIGLKRAEDALRESEKKYRDLFENAEVGMFRTRLDGSEVIDVNRKLLELCGRSREEMIGSSTAIQWAEPREREEMLALLKRNGEVTNYECRILNAQGETRSCLQSLKVFPLQGVLEGSLVDITERKNAEAERLELERRVASSQRLEGLGILAGGVAHNFNNLLTVILGHAEQLRESLPGDGDAASSVREIMKAGYRSRDLIGELLALRRRQVIELKPMDLNTVVRECGSMLRHALRENIAIDYRLSVSPCPVAADPGQIEQILLNLALNSQDAITGEGRLSIATAEVVMNGDFSRRQGDLPPGRYTLLTVGDTGEGMDQETARKIFDPFFTTKEQGRGTGLGLSTVYSIVKQHNGSITVESRPGAGARFMIYFPRGTELPHDGPAAEPEQPAGGTETILLVEDEAPIRTLLSRHLRALGYTVLEAADGLPALRVFDEHVGLIDMLVTDVVMPRMDGTELHRRLHAEIPNLKVLFMTGHQRDHVMQDQRADLIMKPFTGQALASRVREILDRSS